MFHNIRHLCNTGSSRMAGHVSVKCSGADLLPRWSELIQLLTKYHFALLMTSKYVYREDDYDDDEHRNEDGCAV